MAPSFQMVYFTKTVHHDTYDRISPSRPEHSVAGRNVIVTGGGTGIGKSIATSFAKAGASSVSILGRREDRLKSAVMDISAAATDPETIVQYQVADLMKAEEVEAAFKAITVEVGKIDILISNAGGYDSNRPVIDYDGRDLMKVFDYNVLTAFNAVKAFLPVATANPLIISISTTVAHCAPIPGLGEYGLGKAANLKLMNYIAAENPNLHIFNVQPGGIDTEMSNKAGIKGVDAIELPGDFCVWLASPEARFLKDKFVWANWDVDELVARKEEIESSRLFTWLLDGVPM